MIQKRFKFSVGGLMAIAIVVVALAMTVKNVRPVREKNGAKEEMQNKHADPVDPSEALEPSLVAKEIKTKDVKTLDKEIAALETEIQSRQLTIEREQVAKILNENRINEFERKIYFDLLNAQADARTRAIELRLQRLRVLMGES